MDDDDEFAIHLSQLSKAHIWNIYKQFTNEFLTKTSGMPHKTIEELMEHKVLGPLREVILNKLDKFQPQNQGQTQQT